MLGLFVAFGALLALSPAKLPLLAISATSPLFAWIVLEAATGERLRPPPRWLALAALFWFGLFCSLAGNVVLGDLGAISSAEVVLLARYAFWMAVFVVTAAVVARASWTPELTGWLAITALALVFMRTADAAAGGGAWLHQNEYGLRFSAFAPFLLAACLSRPSLGAVSALAVTAAAVLGNGSRSCWIALGAASAVLVLLRLLAGRSARGPLLALTLAPALLAALVFLGPARWSAAVRDRWESLAHLPGDKPFQVRLAMIEKGAHLFAQRPLFGAGLGRFDLERVELAAARAPWTNDEELNQRSSHNSYIGLLAETGLAGSLAFGTLLGALLLGGARAAYRLTRRGEEWAGGAWAAAAAVSIHLWALAGLNGTLPWFIFGLTAGMIERERRRASA
jgi:O-antigen ligase